ncbi:MAG: hypothetical protein COX44_02400 [Candidatus Portnoybacteria bacterium CG23_combo_of_CG06-09_8_20_14_all_37_13]|uniref:Uncharacterized protein n=1 Tax=Candidatus Portnoybacteria bacterium CG23_combo_of_CG06-09_8_20_14_all_37_13 TaxID=1974819 RepID=A0A2G9YCQ2_9BACT|nr:MAG: hypothetical protein COX44_02400 [Candidatus Portnoybacteria bacterium CG23_combo_of_CG06-09_8_20_14_all_37_13]
MNQEYIDAGNIMWKYKKPKHIGHKFGFKRCMIRRLGKDTIIYVAGESLSPEDDNYGKEIFKKIHQ